jgi:hypothetical protein
MLGQVCALRGKLTHPSTSNLSVFRITEGFPSELPGEPSRLTLRTINYAACGTTRI